MKPFLIKAKWPSRCLFCGQEIEVGEEVLYQPGTGVAHEDHFSKDEKETNFLLDQYARR